MDKFPWWTELLHGGIIISNPVLNEVFSEITVDADSWSYRRLRDHYNTFLSKEARHERGTHPVHEWLTHIFEDFLNHPADRWLKGNDIPQRFRVLSRTGIPLRPRRVLMDGNSDPLLLLQTDNSTRLGVHRGRRSYAQFVELLRKVDMPLGILTNGHQLRLVYAGLDHDAWVQWQVDDWFDEGEIRHQLDGLVTLLAHESLAVKDGRYQLLEAVTLSRSRQADLADVLGDQIRQAVEILTSAVGRVQQTNTEFFDPIQIVPGTDTILTKQEMLSALYQVATRLVMRMVIVFYAEAKDLLPKDNPFYLDNYSLEGLYRQLLDATQHEGYSDLETRYSAWPRFLALSQLVHQGSDHDILPLKAYGGTLFHKGDANRQDVVLRALSLFEDPLVRISDAEMLAILRLIKVGKTRVRQGRGFTWVSGPVDFTDLRTEYIGIMYEGLLDYELRTVERDSPKVILNIGNQPILPLALLEPMDEHAIKNLFEKMKVKSESSEPPAEENLSEVFEESPPEEPAGEAVDETTPAGKAFHWALEAVKVTNLVRCPRGRGVDQQIYEERCRSKARELIVKVLEPGEMYLVRWGGTRKGSGTFYTKPALAIPTTQRTLEPLIYKTADDGSRNVRTPRDILDLKICDPAMGSGTFLVAAARYLTEALYEALLAHILVDRDEEGNVAHVPAEIPLTADLSLEAPPLKPTDDGWEEQMKARLKRYVVENCLYGVDINGMAVELARLALWVETMDKELPFEFLEHRLKPGNSLVGTWFSDYQNYPAAAWQRQDGTGSDRRNKTILREKIIPELANLLAHGLQYSILEEAEPPEVVLNRQLSCWSEIQHTRLFDTEKREDIFRHKIEEDPEYCLLKSHFDQWSAVWFWPSGDENRPLLTPANLFDEDERLKDIVNELKARYHFFHWELEFPNVFAKPEGQEDHPTGFHAILGNPPWDIQKPNSQEFFSNYDPIYRTYGKQEALRRQREMFEESSEIEKAWINYSASFKALSNFVRLASDPYSIRLARGNQGDNLARSLESRRRNQPAQHAREHPFRIQGSADLNTYKMFLEVCLHLLQPGGRLGMLIPSGIYTDKGSTELRRLFLNQTDWDWLFVFENRRKLFDIDSRFKYGPLILTKGGRTAAVKSAFMRHDPADWEARQPPHILLPVDRIKRFSPNTLSFMEFKSEKDLEICEKIYGDRPLLGEQVEGGWNVRFAREFDMTNDSHLFTSRRKLEQQGLLSPEEDTRDPRVRVRLWREGWILIHEGKHIHQYTAVWSEPSVPISIEKITEYYSRGDRQIAQFYSPKVIIRQIARNTDTRTSIATFVESSTTTAFSTRIIYTNLSKVDLCTSTYFNSFVVDWLMRMTGNINLTTTLLNIPTPCAYDEFESITLTRSQRMYSELSSFSSIISMPRDRLATKIELDCITAEKFNITIKELEHILGTFPLVDKDLSFRQRQTTLTLEAFKHLHAVGLDRFLEEGWELPDYVTEFDRPGIKVWEPEGGWQQAWAEARAMLSEDEWREFSGKVTISNPATTQGTRQGQHLGRSRQAALDLPEPGTLFDQNQSSKDSNSE